MRARILSEWWDPKIEHSIETQTDWNDCVHSPAISLNTCYESCPLAMINPLNTCSTRLQTYAVHMNYTMPLERIVIRLLYSEKMLHNNRWNSTLSINRCELNAIIQFIDDSYFSIVKPIFNHFGLSTHNSMMWCNALNDLECVRKYVLSSSPSKWILRTDLNDDDAPVPLTSEIPKW